MTNSKDDKPNWLTVTFNLESGFANWISRLFTSEGNYKMMGTDYDNYAVGKKSSTPFNILNHLFSLELPAILVHYS